MTRLSPARLSILRFFVSVASLGAVLGVRLVFLLARAIGPERSASLGAWITRSIGPLTGAHRIAQRNLAAAFPERSEEERAGILRGAWDNLGRTAAEYAHLTTLYDDASADGTSTRIEFVGENWFESLRTDGQPGIIFAAHLGNWELPAVAAARHGLDATAVFRVPNNAAIAEIIAEVRGKTMGDMQASGAGAAFAMLGVMQRGGHLGMLIDQHFTRGVDVTFLGRSAKANPLLAKFARNFECPVHGVRVVRLPEGRFRLELTPPLDLPRNASGEIDIQAATQAMTSVVEGWVREYPEQWLWMHRRWR